MSVHVRSKWIVAQYGILIAVVLAALGLLALGGAWSTYSTPATHQVSETVDEQAFGAGMTTSAEVTSGTALYERGETLSDQPVYFYNATPDVTVRVTTSVPDDRDVAVSQRLVLRHVAAREGDPFWQSQRVLAASEETVSDGAVSVNATLDMPAVRRTVAERRSDIGGVGTFRTELVLSVAYDSGNYADELSPASTVVLTDRAYWFDGGLTANRTHSRTETRQVTDPPDLGETMVMGGFGAGLLLLAIGVAALERREFDLETIEMELTRSRYEEWISRGEIPTKAEKEYIPIDTLEDLVDIAIDSNKRVIYDTTYETYGVVDDDLVYYFAEGDGGFGEWLEV